MEEVQKLVNSHPLVRNAACGANVTGELETPPFCALLRCPAGGKGLAVSHDINIYRAYSIGGLPVAVHSGNQVMDGCMRKYLAMIEGNQIFLGMSGAANFVLVGDRVKAGMGGTIVFTVGDGGTRIYDGLGGDAFLAACEPDPIGLAAAACALHGEFDLRGPEARPVPERDFVRQSGDFYGSEGAMCGGRLLVEPIYDDDVREWMADLRRWRSGRRGGGFLCQGLDD